jgi:threonine synthase
MGPLAFKDVGAVSCHVVWPISIKTKTVKTVLVATSGDTGGAVASGFRCWGRNNHSLSIRKVSNIQEKQLTTLGQNIKARGGWCFDDCQDMVKKAFLDDSLTSQSDFSKFD